MIQDPRRIWGTANLKVVHLVPTRDAHKRFGQMSDGPWCLRCGKQVNPETALKVRYCWYNGEPTEHGESDAIRAYQPSDGIEYDFIGPDCRRVLGL